MSRVPALAWRDSNTHVGGNLRLRGARLDNPGATAASASGLTVDGGLWCRDLIVAGELRLAGARVGGKLELPSARLDRPNGIALNLDRATVAEVDATGLVVTAGQVTLNGVQIAGQLCLDGAQLGGIPGSPALIADGSVIGTSLRLANMHAHGEIQMRTSHIGGRVHLWGATIENQPGTALRLSRTEISADMFCDRMTVIGKVRVAGARIGGRLYLGQVRLVNPGDAALDATGLQAAEVVLLPAAPIQGIVRLSHGRIGLLRDDPACWPDQLQLDGLSYDVLEPPLPARQRLSWLARDPSTHQPQPFEQLAALYSRIGQPAEARRVLHAKERCQRPAKSRLGRVWSLLQDVTVGYGYQPWRAALWFVGFLAAGSAVYAAHPPTP